MIRALFSLALGAELAAIGVARQTHLDFQVITAGHWLIGTKSLKRGDHISAGTPIKTEVADPGSLLLDCGDDGLLLYRCNKGPCAIQACQPNSAPGVAVLPVDFAPQGASSAEVSSSFLKHEPRQPELAGVRAPGNPNDAVLLQSSGSVHFGPALNRVLEGQYCLRLASLPAVQNQSPVVVRINWDRSVDPEGIAPAPGLRSGLYSLEKGSPSNGACQVEADAVAAWVVIASDAAFAGVSAQWKTMAAKIAELPKADVSNDVLMTLRHATLAFVADSLVKR